MTEDYLYGTWWGSRVAGTTLIHETRLLTPHERDRLIGRRLERDPDAHPGHPFRVTRCGDVWDALVGERVPDAETLDGCPACKAVAASDAAHGRCVRCQHWWGYHGEGTGDVCADCHDLGGPCWGHGLGLVLTPEAVPA